VRGPKGIFRVSLWSHTLLFPPQIEFGKQFL